ncbi:unnamed protein product [Arctogadus glacialis]
MGSWESRPRSSQVVPVHSQDQDSEAQTPGDPGPRWTLPALPVPAGQRTRLPPLKRAETTPSTPSGNHKSVESNNRSIIRSHPPKRLQILQPLVFPIGHTNTGTANAMLSGGRSGGIPRYSTPREEEHHGAISQTQEGFLRAQGALRQQAYQHRRAHHRQAREHRRSQKSAHPSNGGPSREGGRLVRRPAERDVFWGEYSGGEGLDTRELLLQPSPLPPLGKRDET